MWLAQAVSLTGSQMQSAAVDWHVYLLTRSPLALGALGLIRVVPIVAFSLWGGVLADRSDRRRMLMASQSAMIVFAAILAGLTLAGSDSLAAIYALTAMTAAAAAFDNPARQALIPRLVPREELSSALSLNLTIFHAAMIGGPAIAGMSIAATADSGREGLGVIYLVNAISFLGVLLALGIMKTSGEVEPGGIERTTVLQSLRDGLRFVFGAPVMVWTMGLDFVATFFSGAMSLIPIVADQILGVGPAGFGWLRSAPALGALGGSLFLSLRPLPRRQGRVFLWAVAAYGAATALFGLSRNYALTYTALVLTGLADLISTVVRQTLRQLLTPDELRGRMTSVNMIFFMGGPQLGELEAGIVASLFATAALGATVSIVSGGVLTILVAGWVAARAPAVRDYDAAA